MKKCLLFFCFVFSISFLFAQNKTWNGASNGLWSTASNWLPVGMPGSTDTVIFNSANSCDLDVSPVIAALRATGVGGNLISSIATRSMTIGNSGAVPSVFSVATGAIFGMGNGGFGISFSTYGTGGANTSQVAGTLVLGFASSWIVNNVGATNITNVDVSGTINLPTIYTGT